MLNEIHIEGIVTGKIWEYGGDRFFRLACYRDPSRPEKPAPNHVPGHSDEPDYVTIRLPNGLVGGTPVTVEKGQRVRIHGYLASRDGRMSLRDFLRQAGDDANELEVGDEHLGVSIDTYRVDLVPERIVIIE